MTKPNICPVCGKPYEYALSVLYDKGKKYCKHDSDVPGKSKVEIRRHANEEASIVAMRMAAEQKAKDSQAGIGEMVNIKGQNGGKTFQVPKKAIESIEKKVAPLLED